MDTLSEMRPIDYRRDMDAIGELMDIAFGAELAVTGTDIRTEIKMIKKMVPVIRVLQPFSDTFKHVFDGYAIEDQGRMIALVNVSKSAPKSKRWVIGNVATHPEYRRKGLARKLVTRAIEYVKEQGGDVCTLEVRSVNTPAYDLYRSLGFEHYDSISELKLEAVPETELIPAEGYSVRPMKLGEWEARYEVARREVPAEVQAFLPVNKAEFQIPGIAKAINPVFLWAQKSTDYWRAFEKNGLLVGYMLLNARRATKVTHRISMRTLPEHRISLIEPMVTLALSQLKGYPKNNTVISVRSSYEDLLAMLKRYGFVVYDEMHRLGLKLQKKEN